MLTEGDGPGRYTFAHALIEHALYEARSAGRRGRIHRRVAEALEELCGDDPADRVGELAYHWARATLPPDAGRAIAYAQQAGDRALAQLAPDEALRWYREALDLLDRASGDDLRSRAVLLLGLGDAQRQTGDPAHRETLFAAGRLADDVDAIDILVRSVLRNSRGWMSIAGGVDRERIEMLELALTRLGDSDSPDRARLLALLRVEITWDAEFDDRLAMATQAVDMARRTGDDAALVDAIRLCNEAISDAPDPARCAFDGTARRAPSPTRSATRPPACTPTTTCTWRDWRPVTPRPCGSHGRSSTRKPSGSDNRSTAWVIEYHDALDWMLAGDLDAAERA